MTEKQMDDYAIKYAPLGIRGWVERVKLEKGRRPKRLDEVKIHLTLELQPIHVYTKSGGYSANRMAT